jgi:hypothetical protein
MKTNKCTNDIHFLNLWHVHMSVVLDLLQGALLKSNTIMCAFVQAVIVYKYIIHNPDTVGYADN